MHLIKTLRCCFGVLFILYAQLLANPYKVGLPHPIITTEDIMNSLAVDVRRRVCPLFSSPDWNYPFDLSDVFFFVSEIPHVGLGLWVVDFKGSPVSLMLFFLQPGELLLAPFDCLCTLIFRQPCPCACCRPLACRLRRSNIPPFVDQWQTFVRVFLDGHTSISFYWS